MSTKIPDDILKLLDAVEEENKRRRTSLTQRIVEWNRSRNTLKYDGDAEVNMLSKEAHAFFTSENLIERLNALADFEFVWIGTLSKYGASQYDNMEEMTRVEKDYQSLLSWKESVYSIMIENIVAEISEHCPGGEDDADWIALLLERVLNVVIEVNETKTLEKGKGRTRKRPASETPKPRIQMAFDEWLKELEAAV